jgi:acyl-coenzyme A thioesterase PaaI-like protein
MVDYVTDEPVRGAIGDLRAFQTAGLEGARRFATLDMKVRCKRPAMINGGGLTAQGHVRQKGNRLRVSSCEINNSEPKRVAMATSSFLMVRGGAHQLDRGRLPDEILRDQE